MDANTNGQENVANNIGDLIDFTPDLMQKENLFEEFKNFKSDLLVIRKELENIKMANNAANREIRQKFGNKITNLNSNIEQKINNLTAQQNQTNSIVENLFKSEEKDNLMKNVTREEIRNLQAKNNKLESENAKMKEIIDGMELEMTRMKNEFHAAQSLMVESIEMLKKSQHQMELNQKTVGHSLQNQTTELSKMDKGIATIDHEIKDIREAFNELKVAKDKENQEFHNLKEEMAKLKNKFGENNVSLAGNNAVKTPR